MVTATPTTIGDVLHKLLDQAIREAGEAPGNMSDFFQQIGRDVGTIVDDLKKIPAHGYPHPLAKFARSSPGGCRPNLA